jgi:GAF domain-containing protein
VDRRAIALGVIGSGVVLAYLLARGPGWESVAVVLAAILPAGLVLYGGAARGRSGALRAAQQQTEQAYVRSERANLDLQERLAELMTLNELAAAAGSTLDRDELLDNSLAAVTRDLRFDRALVLLAERIASSAREVRGRRRQMSAGSRSWAAARGVSQLVQLYHADGPLFFRDADHDPDERNRAFAQMMEVSSFLGTPLVSREACGDPYGDNRVSS